MTAAHDPPASASSSLSRRLWAAGLMQRYPSIENGTIATAGREDAPDGMALILARSLTYAGERHVVRPFYFDRAPVTNAQYRDFLLATGEAPPHHWMGWRSPKGYDEHPVVGVALEQARRYAAWRDARLPTEVEWASVVRGPSGGRRYPWGDMLCDGLRCHCPLLGHAEAGPVRSHPTGHSPEGVGDLYGNVWEWVEPSERLKAPGVGMGRALGGSFAHRCTAWTNIPTSEFKANKGHSYVGFRCAADVPTPG